MNQDQDTFTILVVNTHPDLLPLLHEYFSHERYHLVERPSTSSALSWVAAHRADMILLDQGLPDVDPEPFMTHFEQRGHELPLILTFTNPGLKTASPFHDPGKTADLPTSPIFTNRFPAFNLHVVRRAATGNTLTKTPLQNGEFGISPLPSIRPAAGTEHASPSSQGFAGHRDPTHIPGSPKKTVHSPQQGPPSHPLPIGSGRILVMDDEVSICLLLEQMLNYLGYAVKCAQDGQTAIEMYKRAKGTPWAYSAVILDLHVRQGMGGKETLDHLRRIDPRVKAIVTSGYFHDACWEDYKEAGFWGRISKPFGLEDLSRVLHRIHQEA